MSPSIRMIHQFLLAFLPLFYCMYFDPLLGMHTLSITSYWRINSFILYPLFLICFPALKFVLSKISVAPSAFFFFFISVYLCLCTFICSIIFKVSFLETTYNWVLFFYPLRQSLLYLLQPLIFKVLTDIVGLIATRFIAVFPLLPCSLFLFLSSTLFLLSLVLSILHYSGLFSLSHSGYIIFFLFLSVVVVEFAVYMYEQSKPIFKKHYTI